MSKRTTLLLTAALLLAGCGHAPVTGAQLVAARAAAARAAAPTFGAHLVVTEATSDITANPHGGQLQTFCVAGTCDGKPFSLTTSTFFPYYVPMLGDATVNGKTVKLTKENAAALQQLLTGADTHQVKPDSLSMLLYGLKFLADR